MILLLGASGYFGRAFASELRRRGHSFIPLTRQAFDYTRFDFLFDYLRTVRPAFVINAAGYCGDDSNAPEDIAREKAMSANALLPQMIARVCLMTKIPWGHVSSGSIYKGVKVLENNRWRVEKDVTRRELVQEYSQSPDRFQGFTEIDEPNFSFRFPPCDFYNGTKALAEEAIREIGQSYIWRMREPFNERNEPCNLLGRLDYSGLSGLNSLSHLEDCVRACLDLREYRAPFGIYNVVNPGAIDVGVISQQLQRRRKLTRFASTPIISQRATRNSPTNCVLDASKLLKAGVKIRPLDEAIEDSLDRWESSARRALQTERAFTEPSAILR
jgi:dTDP-4-dehydrorhamnose reductase